MAIERHVVAGRFTRRVSIVAVCLNVILSSMSLAGLLREETSEDDLRPKIRVLLKQLGESTRSSRAQAERTLLELGPDILPLLPPPDLLESASVRLAVRRVRVRLEHDVAELSLRPSTVTLAGSFSVNEIVREVEKQTTNVISTELLSQDLLDQKISLNQKEATFWEVISRLESAGLNAGFDNESGLLKLSSKPQGTARFVSAIDRSFRIEASPLTTPGNNSDVETLLSAQLRILCEPRLRPLFLRYRTNDFRLTLGDDGQTVESFNAGASIEVPLGNGGREAGLSVSFLTPGNVPKAASLHGTVNLLVAASEQPILFRSVGQSKRVSRRRGGVTVTVNEVAFEDTRPAHHNARIQLRVNYDLGAHAFESHQTWVFHNRVYLIDPDGKQYGPNGGFSTLFQGDGSVGIEYAFEDLPRQPTNWDFVYVAPTLLIDVEVPINLSNIPISQSVSRVE